MNKHQTLLVYLKYGNWINEINDKISDSDIKHDMFKFLVNFPGMIKQPVCLDQFNTMPKYIPISSKTNLLKRLADKKYRYTRPRLRGIMTFFVDLPPSPLHSIKIIFDGKNNLQLWFYKKSLRKYKWTSLNNLETYVKIRHNVFSKLTN